MKKEKEPMIVHQFTSFLKCPKKAWLFEHKNELAVQNEEAARFAENLKEVKAVARDYFGRFVDGGKDLDRTSYFLQKGEAVIADAAFSAGSCCGTIDLLRRTEEGYEAYIVKASTSFDKVWAQEAAFLHYLLQSAGISISGIYVLHLNDEYRRHGALDIEKLFVKKRLNNEKEFQNQLSSVKENLALLSDELNHEDEPATIFRSGCKNECPFFAYCSRNLPSPNVFDISRFKKSPELANRGVLTFKAISQEAELQLSKRQKAQLEAYLGTEKRLIDRNAIKSFLNQLSYPIYHLDFETISITIPRFEGSRPNESMPTQYSLHIEYEDGHLEHKEFLGNSEDTRRAIAESLCKNIPEDACVTAYNKSFECGRLAELAEAFPDLSTHLLAIKDNIIDLMAPFQNGDYYDDAMNGSYSIKSVLPALYPNDSELDYHALSLVHHGGEAMDAYPRMLKADPEEKEAIRKALLAYCRLDTLAMVRVLQKLKEAIV